MFCLIYRLRINDALNAGRPIPRAAQRHCERCSSCHRFCESQMRIEELLRGSGYQGETAGMPPYLATRIRAHLRTENSTRYHSPKRGRSHRLLASAGTAVILAGIVVFLFRGSFPANDRNVVIRDEISAAGPDHDPVQAETGSVGPLIERLAANPLESEMRLLANDTQSALDYLAATFVPSDGGDASRL